MLSTYVKCHCVTLRLTPWETGGSQDSRNGCNAGRSVTPSADLQERLEQHRTATSRMRLICVDTTVLARTKTWTQRTPNQTNLNRDVCKVKCHCGKTCKNARGLKIHQIYVRSSCTNGEIQAHCTDLKLSEAGEICAGPTPESHRSLSLNHPQWIQAGCLQCHSSKPTQASEGKNEMAKGDAKEWSKLDKELEIAHKETAERKTDSMTSPTTWQKNALKHCQKESTKADEKEGRCKEERTSII